MLILTRKPGESLYIGDGVKVVVVEVKGSQVRLGIEADKSVRIYREEIYLQILEENKKAAEAAQGAEGNLEGLSDAWQDSHGEKRVPGQVPPMIRAPGKLMSRPPERAPSMPLGGSALKEKSEDPEVLIKRRKKKSDE